MGWFFLATLLALTYLGTVSANLEISTIEKDVVVMNATYKCTFRLVHDEEEAVVDSVASTVSCNPTLPYTHIPVNNVQLEDEDHVFMVDFQMNPDEIIQGEFEALTSREEFLAAGIVEEEDDEHFDCSAVDPRIPVNDTDFDTHGADTNIQAGAHHANLPLWRNAIVPYTFDYTFNQQDRLTFAKAIQQIEAKTCLKFKPRRSERQYLKVFRKCQCRGSCFGGGYATLGAGSPARLTIGSVCLTPSSASGVKLVAHEILHSLGVGHTQTRPDRDNYIDIYWGNINTKSSYNYNKCPSCQTHGTPYDCMSIMHYRDWAFSINRQPTMRAKNPSTCDLKTAAYYLSNADIKLLNAMYGCQTTKPINGGWSKWSSWSTCSSGTQYKYRVCNSPKPASGGKKCSGKDKMNRKCSGGKSWKKNGGSDCYEGKGAKPIKPDPYSNSLSLSQCQSACLRTPGCEGIVRKESDGENAGICYLRKEISLGSCETNNIWTTYEVSSSTTNPNCLYTDKNKDCNQWKDLHCNQGKWKDWMSENCAKTCKCGGTTKPPPSCTYTDKNKDCPSWKDLYCNHAQYKEYMSKNCAKTCKCGGTTTTTTTVTTKRPVTNNNFYGCKYGIQRYPSNLPNAYYYKRICITRQNLKIITGSRASDASLERTAYLIDHVMDKVDPRVAKAMNRARFRHAVMGNYPSELTTHLPEYRHLGTFYNERARGLGATTHLPLGSSAEENAMCYRNDRYLGEDITIHEFAHSLHLTGFELVFSNFKRELEALYYSARSRGLWGGSTYAMTDYKEYFAEGVQSYFNANMHVANAPTDRNSLRRRDPNLYRFLNTYLGGNTWSRTCPSRG